MLSSSIQVALQLAGCLFSGLALIFIYHIIYILAVTAVKSLYKLMTQVYNGSLKLSPSSDRAILITGATSGFGLALSKYFNAQGYSIIAGYCSDQESGYDELVKLNQDKGGKSIFLVRVDFRSQESIKESYEKVSEILSKNRFKLHALINNAGILQCCPSHWTRSKDIVAMAEANLIGPMLMARQYMPLLIKTQGSRLVNVCSILGRSPVPNNATYCATKAGLSMFGNALAFDIGKHNVKVVTIYLGNDVHHTMAIGSNLASELNAIFRELPSEERDLYENEFRAHERSLNAFDQSIENFQSGVITKPADMKTLVLAARRRSLDCLHIASGAVKRRRIKLEESSFMESFDNAINMRNPPSEMSAGNRYFAILTHSFFGTIGHDVVQLISWLSSSIQMEEFV